MSGREFAQATLDTFPINVAVLDEDGDIVFTNHAWRAFAHSEGGVADHEQLGTNYFAASDVDDDAVAAVEGIREVLAGERERFRMEYPCHSPTERRWFLMRVSPVDVGGRRRAVVAHADITDRKEAELAADERADQLAHLLERVDGLVRTVTAAVVEARSRPAVERRLCEAVVETDPYTFAWVGRADLRAESLVPRAWSGDGPGDVEGRTSSLSTEAPAARAYRTGQLQVASADGTDGDGRDDGASAADGGPDTLDAWGPVPGARAVAAVPLSYRATTYGVLSVYADRSDAFDERERTVLRALGEVAATAVHAVTSGRVLRTNSVVEVEVELWSPGTYLAVLTADDATTLRHHDALVDDDGTVRVFATVAGSPPDVVVERAADCADLADVRVLTEREEGTLFEFTVERGLVAGVADFDGITTELSAAGGTARATFSFPDETAARAAFEHLQGRYERVELVGYRERERTADTAGGFRARLESSLTDRQLTALRTAYYSGYFEWPHDVPGEEVAEAMGITRATFHQHLRAAQRKLAAAMLEPGRP